LVLIAAALVGLLALSGSAMAGGSLSVEHTRVQSAADAASLAGTQLVALTIQTCDTIDMPALDAEIDRTINHYAEQNGISDTNDLAGAEVNDNVVAYYVDKDGTPLGQVGEMGALPLSTAGILAEVQDENEALFILLFGIDAVSSSAQAMSISEPKQGHRQRSR